MTDSKSHLVIRIISLPCAVRRKMIHSNAARLSPRLFYGVTRVVGGGSRGSHIWVQTASVRKRERRYHYHCRSGCRSASQLVAGWRVRAKSWSLISQDVTKWGFRGRWNSVTEKWWGRGSSVTTAYPVTGSNRSVRAGTEIEPVVGARQDRYSDRTRGVVCTVLSLQSHESFVVQRFGLCVYRAFLLSPYTYLRRRVWTRISS